MAKIFLVWNTHADEAPVTGPMAEKLKAVLEKKGQGVSVVKIPEWKSTWGDQSYYTGWTMLFLKRATSQVKKLSKKNPDSFIFELHCTPSRNYFEAKVVPIGRKITRVKHWKARETPEVFLKAHLQIFPHAEKGPNVYGVEFPAFYNEAPKSLKRFLRSHYLEGAPEKEAHLKASKAYSFLSPLAVRKLAHLIDTMVNTRLGVYRKPRGEPFKRKGPRRASKPGMPKHRRPR